MNYLDAILNGNTIRVPKREGEELPEVGDSVALIQQTDDGTLISSAIVISLWYWSKNEFTEIELMSYYKSGHKVNDGHVLIKTIYLPW